MSTSVKRAIILCAIGCLLFGLLAGILFQKFYGVGRIIGAMGTKEANSQPYSITDGRVQVSPEVLKPKMRLMVALVFGQSNSANFGETLKAAKHGVYNLFRGKLYVAQDPMLGADGKGGSVWTRLGDKLIERNVYDAVVFVPIGVGSTEIARWQPHGDLHQSILDAIEDVNRQGLSITHLLWHQGETDALNKTPKAAYKAMFLEMLASIRRHGVEAPIYVSTATLCGKWRENKEIQEAQAELISVPDAIFRGPNTDSLGLAFRYDGCHFSDEGLAEEAALWLSALHK